MTQILNLTISKPVLTTEDADNSLAELIASGTTLKDLVAATEAMAGGQFADALASFQEAAGVSGLVGAYAEGGIAGLTDAISNMADANGFKEDLDDMMGKQSNTLADQLGDAISALPGLADMLDSGPEEKELDPGDFQPGGEAMLAWWVPPLILVAVGTAMAAGAAAYKEETDGERMDKVLDSLDDVDYMPADPDAVDPEDLPPGLRSFLEQFQPDLDDVDPTYGQTMPGHDQDDGEFQPDLKDADDELDQLILTDQDKVKITLSDDYVREMAQAKYDQTTQPADPDEGDPDVFEFFGGTPKLTGGDLTGGNEGPGELFVVEGAMIQNAWSKPADAEPTAHYDMDAQADTFVFDQGDAIF